MKFNKNHFHPQFTFKILKISCGSPHQSVRCNNNPVTNQSPSHCDDYQHNTDIIETL